MILKIHAFELPIAEPVLVFTFVLLIVLLVPLLLRNTKTPAIIGLIIIGIVIGPNALNIIDNNDIIELFSKVGLLYIMFLAALDIEFAEFRKTRNQSIFFGLLSFMFPFVAGYFAAVHVLHLPLAGSVLVGILLASNTLIAFPVVKKLNISRSLAVNVAISGTVIADTIVLSVLAFTTAVLLDDKPLVTGIGIFALSFILFSFIIFWGVPKLSRWFFRTIPADSHTQFLFVIAMLFASSFGAEIAGAEPIIGAFFAGLALNRLIPGSSTLMSHIELVGNTLFIPVFLISVGMLVDIGAVFANFNTLAVAMTLIIIAIVTKWLPSFLTKIIFRQSINEMNTIFGLTTARAAATLAIALVGFNYGVMDKDLFNAVILLILISSLISSYITEKSGRKLSLDLSELSYDASDAETERILVPISNPATIEKLTDIAIYIRSVQSLEPVYTLKIVNKPDDVNKVNLSDKALLEKIVGQAATMGVRLQNINRLDVSIPQAIIKTSSELLITKIILGWSGRSQEMNKIFGNILDTTLKGTGREVIVCNLPLPLNTMDQINVFVPENAEHEIGFSQWVRTLINLNRQLGTKFTIFTLAQTRQAIVEVFRLYNFKQQVSWSETNDLNVFFKEAQNPSRYLHVILSSRPQYLSFKLQLWRFTYDVPEVMGKRNFLIIYPRQI